MSIKPIEEYSMNDEEIEQAKNEALIRFLMVAERSKNPEITFVVGQPGAGKTGLAVYSTKEIQKKDGSNNLPVSLNADVVAKYHKDYEQLLSYPPEDRMRITRKFVNVAMPYIQDKLVDKNVSMVMECTLNSEKKLDFMKKLKARGYNVNINVLVVNGLESRMSCLEREAKMLQYGEKPRGIDKDSHDKTYVNMLTTLAKALENGCCDSINLYRRGKETEIPEHIYTAKPGSSKELISKINSERAAQGAAILENPEAYRDRLRRVTEVFENYFVDENAKENAFSRVEELKNEFDFALAKQQGILR